MSRLLHDRQRRFTTLLALATSALRASVRHDPDLPTLAAGVLGEAAWEYAAMGLSAGENVMVALRAELSAAGQGMDPTTGLRVSGRRREYERAAGLRVLLAASQQLRADQEGVATSLRRAREQLAPLAVFAVGRGFVPADAGGVVDQAALEQIWQRLLADSESAASARSVAVDVHDVDVVLLLADLLAAMGPTPSP